MYISMNDFMIAVVVAMHIAAFVSYRKTQKKDSERYSKEYEAYKAKQEAAQ